MSVTVLVIDDSEDDRHLYRHALRDFGCSLEMAATAEAGLARIAQAGHGPGLSKHPDLILLDYNLPDADGLSFMKRLAEYTDLPIPIVMLTGEDSAEVAVEAMKHGAEDYLVKDIEGRYLRLLPTVLERVKTAWAQREQTKRLQQETGKLLRRNQALMQNSMDGIHVLDMRGNLLEANDAFCRMLGYTREEMAGFSVADWDAQWSDEEMLERRKALVGKSAKFETLHRRKDGSLLHVEVSLSGTEIDGQHLFFAASRDISERKRAEGVLRLNKTIIENAYDGFWMFDTDGYLRDVNQAYADMVGHAREELLGMHISQLSVRSNTPELVRAQIEAAIGNGSGNFETQHRHKDGHVVDFEASIAYIPEAQCLFSFIRDVTERKRAGEEQRLSAQLLNSTSDSVFLFDLDGNFVYLNEAAWKSRGYARDELMAMNVRELTTPEFSKLVSPRMKEMLKNGHGIIESEHRCKDGSVMSVEVNSRVIESGGRKLLLSACRDITERKKAEAVLRQYKQVLDTSIDGFWVTDMKGYLLEANEAYAKISGYAVEELVGMHISQLEAKEQVADVHAHLEKLLAQGYDRFETRHRHKSGHEIDIEISCTYMADTHQLVVFCRDISERKQAYREVQRNQDLLNEAQRLGKLGSWELDLLSGVLFWSDEMYRIFELDPARFARSYDGFLSAIHPDDRDKVNQAYTQSLLDRQPYDVVHRLLLADGRIKWVREHCSSEFDASGKPLRSRGMSQDITERMEAEAALLRNEANLRAMLDNSPYLTWLKDADGRYISVNRVFADYLRLDDARQAAGKTDLDLQPRALAEKYRADDAEVMAARQQKHVEEAAFDGKNTHWVETYKTPIIDDGGNVLGTVGFARDITERKRMQLENDALLRRNQVLMRTSLDGIHVLDMQGNVVEANEAFCRMLGYSREEMAGLNAVDWSAEFSREQLRARFDDHIAKSVMIETVHRRKDGSLINVEISVSGEVIDGQGLLFCSSRDITERKKAERELRQENQSERKRADDAMRLHSVILKNLTEGVSLVRAGDGLFVFTNPQFERMFGYEAGELLGRHVSVINAPDERNPEMVAAAIMAELARTGTWSGEVHNVKKDGTTLWTRARVSEFEHPSYGKVWVAAQEDITERKRIERQARELSAHLQAVREEEKASFAREIHDDLGSTLTALKMDASWLARKLEGDAATQPLRDCAQAMLGLLDNAVKATRRIITDLRPTLLDDLGLLAALKWQADQFYKRTGIECRVICTCGEYRDCEGQLDKTLSINLFRIFQEALNNVVRHSGASRVEVEFSPGSSTVCLSISDNGCGVPEGQVIAPTSYGIRGMRERVGPLGGSIELDRPAGGGLCVRVRLPLSFAA